MFIRLTYKLDGVPTDALINVQNVTRVEKNGDSSIRLFSAGVRESVSLAGVSLEEFEAKVREAEARFAPTIGQLLETKEEEKPKGKGDTKRNLGER